MAALTETALVLANPDIDKDLQRILALDKRANELNSRKIGPDFTVNERTNQLVAIARERGAIILRHDAAGQEELRVRYYAALQAAQTRQIPPVQPPAPQSLNPQRPAPKGIPAPERAGGSSFQ